MGVTSNADASAICDLMRFFLEEVQIPGDVLARLDPEVVAKRLADAEVLVKSSYRKLQAGVRPDELREMWDRQFTPELLGSDLKPAEAGEEVDVDEVVVQLPDSDDPLAWPGNAPDRGPVAGEEAPKQQFAAVAEVNA